MSNNKIFNVQKKLLLICPILMMFLGACPEKPNKFEGPSKNHLSQKIVDNFFKKVVLFSENNLSGTEIEEAFSKLSDEQVQLLAKKRTIKGKNFIDLLVKGEVNEKTNILLADYLRRLDKAEAKKQINENNALNESISNNKKNDNLMQRFLILLFAENNESFDHIVNKNYLKAPFIIGQLLGENDNAYAREIFKTLYGKSDNNELANALLEGLKNKYGFFNASSHLLNKGEEWGFKNISDFKFDLKTPMGLRRGKLEELIDIVRDKFDEWAQNLEEKITSQINFIKSETVNNSVKGLVNIGNTCFINATLQALFATPDLNRLLQLSLADVPFNPNLNDEQKNNSIFTKLQKLFSKYVNTAKDYISRKPLVEFRDKVVVEVMPNYQCGNQEDAQEFINLLFQRLSSELNASEYTKFAHGYSLNDDEQGNFQLSRRVDKLREHSVINNMFSGYFRSDLRRLDGRLSTKYEAFELLSISGLEKAQDNLALEDLIEENLGEERIDDVGTKNISLELLPRYLVIQLKRFEFDPDTKEIKKIKKPINFPNDLDIASNRALKNYELYATVNHEGVYGGGHYWGYVLKDGKWYKVNDKKVNEKSINAVLSDNKTSYFLFYKVKQ